VSITMLAELRELATRYPRIRLVERPYAEADLDAHDIVFAATDDPALHRTIVTAAHQRRLLVNVADTPALCDFYLSSVVVKGQLKIAVSTNGKSPTVGKRLRAVLEDTLPEELDEVLEQMTIIRNRLAGDFANKVKSLNAVTAELAGGKAYESPTTKRWRRVATGSLLAIGALVVSRLVRRPE
jgi:siroheme synthase-like protein